MHFAYESVQSVINNLAEHSKARLENIPSLAIVVPVLNEIERLPLLLKELVQVEAEHVIIVDGGSTDGSVQWLEKHFACEPPINTTLIQSPSGRAKQMNAGAEKAKQDILLFLHADTVLPVNAKLEINTSYAKEFLWGRFDVEFDEPCLAMRLIAFFINMRSKLSKIATGDQAMFIERELFEKVDGFDDIALMEDVAMSKKLYKRSSPYASTARVITSARRWKQNGVLRTVIKMWWYRLAYSLGVSPDSLAQGYRNVR